MNFLFFTMETVSNLSAWINHKIPKEKKLKDLYRAKQTPEEKGNTFSRSGDRVVCGGNWREQSRETSITTQHIVFLSLTLLRHENKMTNMFSRPTSPSFLFLVFFWQPN